MQIANTTRPSPLVDLEVKHKQLFLDQEIIVKIIITSLLIIFPGETFDGIEIFSEG
jgi:hypothetical protein